MMMATVIVTKDRNNDGDIKQEQQEPQEPPRPLPLAAQGPRDKTQEESITPSTVFPRKERKAGRGKSVLGVCSADNRLFNPLGT